MTALTERKDPALAVRWAREGVALDNNDGRAHALLADMLYAAHEYKDSVDEYRLAMAGRPDDDDAEARARSRAQEGRRRQAGPPARKGARREGGGAVGRRAGRGRRRRGQERAAPSAPAEPAADEQK